MSSLHNYEEEEEAIIRRLDMRAIDLLTKRLWPYVRQESKVLYFSLFFILISTVCSLLLPWMLGWVVDNVLLAKRLDLVLPLAGAIFFVGLIRGLSTYTHSYSVDLLGQRILHVLRQDLLKKYQFYPVGEFNRTPAGRLVTRLVNDTNSLQELFTGGIAVSIGNIAVVLGIIIWLIVLHPSLGLVCVSVFPVVVFIARKLGVQIREAFRRMRASVSRLNAFLAENISGMWIIQLFNQQEAFNKRFRLVSSALTRSWMGIVKWMAYFHPTTTILSSLSMALLIWYGGFKALNTEVTLGLLVAFMAYLQALFAPIRDLTEKYNLVLAALTACERIFSFMDLPSEKGTDIDKSEVPLVSLNGEVSFKNVFFSYDEYSPVEQLEDKWVLKDLNFHVKAGEKIGIVGHTGAGKTTLSALLMRFHDIQKGTIEIDNQSIMSFDKRSLRKNIGYIQQEPFLFTGTVADNIFLWKTKLVEKYFQLPAFLREPFSEDRLSLNKEIFERGANLSAGEKQVISFMRCLIHDPNILILDEATAHLDSLTEGWIDRVSNDWFAKKTVFIIAHRLATLKAVDRIFVLHKGQLVEQGTHEELMSLKGRYHRLYEFQVRKQEVEGNEEWLEQPRV